MKHYYVVGNGRSEWVRAFDAPEKVGQWISFGRMWAALNIIRVATAEEVAQFVAENQARADKDALEAARREEAHQLSLATGLIVYPDDPGGDGFTVFGLTAEQVRSLKG